MRRVWLRHGASPEEVMRRKLTGLVDGQKKDLERLIKQVSAAR
jgi:hypothetical protein